MRVAMLFALAAVVTLGTPTSYGEVVALTWAWPIAVLDRAPGTRTVASATFDTTAAVTGDGTIHLGEP